MLNNKYTKIIDGYVINLESDKERKRNVINEFINSSINLKFFNAIKHETGWIGCLKSHLELIKFAKENNMDMILVIEDDAYIENKNYFNNIFPKIINYLKENKDKWTIFNGGPSINKHAEINNVINMNQFNLYELSKCCSTTLIIYNSTIYDHFIKFLHYPDDKLKSTHKIDMIIYNTFNCIVPYPTLVWQIESYSHIYNKYRDDLQIIKNNTDIIFKRLIKKI